MQDLVYLEFTQKFPSTINGLSRVSRYSVQFVTFHLFEFDFSLRGGGVFRGEM